MTVATVGAANASSAPALVWTEDAGRIAQHQDDRREIVRIEGADSY